MLWFRISNRNELDKIIITAMDRFVWLVLLVVMSHLVTEFTRVTSYARGNRHELMPINESLMEPKTVQNMLLYPGQQEYGIFEQSLPSYYYQNNNKYPYNVQQLQQQQQQPPQPQQPNAQLIFPTSGTQQGFTFSFRPLIDSIFDIPISTLRAVNNLVARLTGSYQAPAAASAAPYSPQKSASLVIETERSNGKLNGESNSNLGSRAYPSDAAQTARSRSSTLREEIA